MSKKAAARFSVTVDAKALRAVTAQGLRTTSKRGSVAVLGCLHLEATGKQLTVSSTDMDITQRIKLPVTAATPGAVLAPAKALDKALSTFQGEVTVAHDEDSVTVSQGTDKVKLITHVLEDFPVLPKPEGGERTVVMLAPAFNQVYGFVQRHASSDESRPVLTGVLVETEENKVIMAATDSYRLAVSWAEGASLEGALGPKDNQPIVRAAALAEVARLLKKELDYTEIRRFDKWLSFTVGNIEIITRLIDGQFPNWRQLVPENVEDTTVVDRVAFAKAIDRMDKLQVSRHAPVKLRFFENAGTIRLSLEQQDYGSIESHVPVVSTTPPSEDGRKVMELGLNASFLLDAINSFDGPDISIGTINPLRPALLHNGRDGEFVLQMPIRLAG